MAVNDEKLNRGLPGGGVGKADRRAGRFAIRTLGCTALQDEGGATVGRRERPAVDDQANALEAGCGLIQRFSFGGQFGVHRVLPKVMVTLAVSQFSK
jgi:hypothetical protein